MAYLFTEVLIFFFFLIGCVNKTRAIKLKIQEKHDFDLFTDVLPWMQSGMRTLLDFFFILN